MKIEQSQLQCDESEEKSLSTIFSKQIQHSAKVAVIRV